MGSQKNLISKEKLNIHKLRSAMRFLVHLHKEIELANSLDDIRDKAILDKFQEYIEVLQDELKDKI